MGWDLTKRSPVRTSGFPSDSVGGRADREGKVLSDDSPYSGASSVQGISWNLIRDGQEA